MFNILITGSKGQLGSELKELSNQYQYNFFFTDKDSLDITKEKALLVFVELHQIDIIINCAAYTAVDSAEVEKKLANEINHIAVANLANVVKEKSIKLIHISTDYVFDGTNCKPYIESDIANPKSVYGQTKLDGEKSLIKINPSNSIIIRTSWVYSYFGANFVKTMLHLGSERESLGVVFDQIGTPTYAKDLAYTILEIIPKVNSEEVEIFHYSNEGVVSWYDFTKEIMKMAKLDCIINPIESVDYPTPAKRPYYSVLNKKKIKTYYEIEIPFWKDGLDDCLKRLGVRK